VPEIQGPEIQGHRGARALRPENTLPGLAQALAIGVDALEFDVTLTSDGGLILAHDLVVEAQTILDTGPATDGDAQFPYVGKRWSELTLGQIQMLDAGDRRPPGPFGDTFVPVPGTGVPTLDQVCRLVTEAGADRVVLAVELKSDPSWAVTDVRALVTGAIGTLAGHGLAGRARILGFDWRVLKAAEAADPAVPRVALVEPRTWVPGSAWLAGLDPAAYPPGPGGLGGCAPAARDVGAQWLSPWDGMTSAAVIAATHRAGLRVAAWTVNDPARMAELRGLGADAIVTDRPDRLRQVLASFGDPVPPARDLPWPGGVPAWVPRAKAALT
jgi:glycerophosphoryl diester phosphodiesterase